MEVRSYKDLGVVPLLFDDEEILDRVIELYSQFQSRWAIRDILTKELEFKKPISIITIGILIGRAKLKITEQLKIKNPQEYRGRIVYFLELLLGGKAKNRDKLKALEMLALYTGVEKEVQEDPSDYAKRVALAIREMDISVGGTQIEEEQNGQQEYDKEEEREGEKRTQSGEAKCESTSPPQESGS